MNNKRIENFITSITEKFNIDSNLLYNLYIELDLNHKHIADKKNFVCNLIDKLYKIGILDYALDDYKKLFIKRIEYVRKYKSVIGKAYYEIFIRENNLDDYIKVERYYKNINLKKSINSSNYNKNNPEKISFTKDKYIKKYGIEKYTERMNKNKQNIKNITNPIRNLNFFVEKYGDEVGKNKYNQMTSKKSKSMQGKNLNNSTNLKYFVDKYGECDGYKKWSAYILKRMKIQLPSSFNEITDDNLKTYIEHFVNKYSKTNNFLYINNHNINNILPTTFFSSFCENRIKKVINDLGYNFIESSEIYKSKLGIYMKYSDNGVCLRSYNEIKFYNILKEHFKLIEGRDFIVGGNYSESNLKYDFKIKDKYIEICGGVPINEKEKQNDYMNKMDYKKKIFNSILIWDNKKYYEIIEEILNEKDKN